MLRDVQRSMARVHSGTGTEGAVYAGLDALTKRVLSQEWNREDGAMMRVERCLVDQGWLKDVVHQFCRQSSHAGILMPARGHGITASQKPISEYDRKRGDKIGQNWWIPSLKGRRALRRVEVDTNFWKSFAHERFATALGDSGCLSIFGGKPEDHRLLSEHLTAEYRVRTEGRGRVVDEWKLPPHRPDNHWFDCLVGCLAGASMCGVTLGSPVAAEPGPPRKRLKLSDLQKQKGQQRG